MGFKLDATIVKLEILDRFTNRSLTFECKMPESADRLRYISESTDALVKNSKNTQKALDEQRAVKNKFAEEFILSFQPGYFELDGKGICAKPEEAVKADPENPEVKEIVYYPEWFAMLKRKRSDIIEKIIENLFGETCMVVQEDSLNFLHS